MSKAEVMRISLKKLTSIQLLVFLLYIQNISNFLKENVSGKRVLDCGAAGEEGIGEDSPYWMHNIIKSKASEVIGFDLEEEAVEELNKKGYKMLRGDCENLDLGEVGKFDVIFAGEVLEHLTMPGEFIEGVKKYLKDDGELIITTPNAFSFYRFAGNIVRVNMENPQHVLVQNEDTLIQLLERHGYSVVESHFFTNQSFYEQKRMGTARKAGKHFFELLFSLKPEMGHQILIIATIKNTKTEL
jgi:2-polyprenyl-3-methyl-5-hydroxy-6-metoxy-1,4-benzoquinol methylase